jgi:hypothetical protein
VNRKRVLRVMRERGLLVRKRRLWGPSQEGVGPRGSQRAESNLAIGHDENLGGSGHGLGVPSECDRLLHAGDSRLESLTPLPNRRRTSGGGASCATWGSCWKPRGELDADHRQWDAVHFFSFPRSPRTARHHASANRLKDKHTNKVICEFY